MRIWTVHSLQGGDAVLAARLASSAGLPTRKLRKPWDNKLSLLETASEVCGIFVPNSDASEIDMQREMQALQCTRYGNHGR